MSVITVFHATYCNEKEVVEKVARELDYKVVGGEILELASELFKTPVEKLLRSLEGPPPLFNQFTREKERHVAYIRAALARSIREDNLVHRGFAGHLIPRGVDHVVRVCLVADREYRKSMAVRTDGVSEKEAKRKIAREDEARARWTQFLFDMGPWDERLYDIKIPMHSTTADEAVRIVCDNAGKDVVRTTDASRRAVEDFILSADVFLALVEEGHFDLDVACREGVATIVVKKNVLRLGRLEGELKRIAGDVPAVKEVIVEVGPKFHEPYPYRRLKFDLPAKVLLVDDEKEFVQTLSERLRMREFGTAVAQDGEEALSLIENDEPEVMVLDLRMPGIDGIEVLRRVKRKQPRVEVIILTGHGTEKNEEEAMALGAFAYLEKPVDIDKLSQTMKEAYEKIKRKKADD